jgi:ATP-dependent protease ClpP protease subunit
MSKDSDLYEYGIDTVNKRIMLTGMVSEDMLNRVIAATIRFDLKEGDVFTCDIATMGGCLYNGLGIYDLLQMLKARGVIVRMRAVGYVMSMGVTLLQAASPGERLLSPNCTTMIHQGQETVPPDIHPNDHKRLVKEFDRISKLAFVIIADRMGMSVTAWKKKHPYDTYFDAKGSIAAGLADRITEV